MIAGVTGTPGSGKSFYCVRLIVDSLLSGLYVVTNVPLARGWAMAIALRNPFRRLLYVLGFRAWAERKAAWLEDRCAIVRSLDEMMSWQFGCGVCSSSPDFENVGYCVRGHQLAEARAIAVIDEAHEWLNNRMWDEDKQLRAKYVNWFSTHRHNGLDVYVVTQHIDSLDKQVRDRVEYHVTLRNLRRAKVMGIPIAPVNVFLAVWVWTQGAKGVGQRHVNKRDVFLLDSRRQLYSTHGAALAYDPSRPTLPHSAQPPASPEGAAAAPDVEQIDEAA